MKNTWNNYTSVPASYFANIKRLNKITYKLDPCKKSRKAKKIYI